MDDSHFFDFRAGIVKFGSIQICTFMKKFIITLMAAAVMLFAGSQKSSAQDFNFDPEQMAQMRVDQMKQSLKLTDDQSAKLLEIFKKQNEEMGKLFAGGGMPDMGEFQKMMEKQDIEIKKVLTEEQAKAYDEQQKKMREQFGGGF